MTNIFPTAANPSPLKQSFTIALIKSRAMSRGHALQIITDVVSRGFVITKFQKMKLCPTTVAAFYAPHVDKPYYTDLEKSVSETPIIVMQLTHMDPTVDTPALWREHIGATNSSLAGEGTLRSIYGGHRYVPNPVLADNAFHGSDSAESAQYEYDLLFNDGRAQTPAIGMSVHLAATARDAAFSNAVKVITPYIAHTGGTASRTLEALKIQQDKVTVVDDLNAWKSVT